MDDIGAPAAAMAPVPARHPARPWPRTELAGLASRAETHLGPATPPKTSMDLMWPSWVPNPESTSGHRLAHVGGRKRRPTPETPSPACQGLAGRQRHRTPRSLQQTVLCGVAGGTQDERQDRGARKGARCRGPRPCALCDFDVIRPRSGLCLCVRHRAASWKVTEPQCLLEDLAGQGSDGRRGQRNRKTGT